MNFFGKKEKKFQIPIQNVAQQMQAPQPIHGGGGGQMGQLMQQGQIFGPQQLVCGPNQTKNEFFWGKKRNNDYFGKKFSDFMSHLPSISTLSCSATTTTGHNGWLKK